MVCSDNYAFHRDITPPWALRTRRALDLFQATRTSLTEEGLLRLGRRLTEATQPPGTREDQQDHAEHLWTRAVDNVVFDELDSRAPYGCDVEYFDDLRGLIAAITVDELTRQHDLDVVNGVRLYDDADLAALCAGMVKVVWQETYGGGNAMGEGSRSLEDYEYVLCGLWQTLTGAEAHLTGQDRAYFLAVRWALSLGRVTATSWCTECDQDVSPGDEEHSMFGEVVVIGCQGYYMVDPSAVGIHLPNWTPTPA